MRFLMQNLGMIDRWDGNNTDDIFNQLMEGVDFDVATTLEDDEKRKKVEGARSTAPQSFDRFNEGDAVILTLVGEPSMQGASIPAHLIAGKLIDSRQGLVDIIEVVSTVTPHEEIRRLIGKTVGFAYGIEISADKATRAAVQRRIAGNQDVAYYLADEMLDVGFGERAPDPENIKYLPLKFGRALVAGTVLFDFITPESRL
jgi:hypothetical protein